MSTDLVPDPYSTHTPAREQGNQYALRALRERRAFMTGELQKLEERRRWLKESLAHLDATLAIMVPGCDPTLIKAKYPRRKSKLFGAGKLNFLILGVLRKGERAMSLDEIVAGVVADAGWDASDPTALKGMKPRVRSNLLYLTSVRGLTAKEGERTEARWRLTSN